MKAITVRQLWATLLAFSLKRFETRSWSTAWRGPIVIHAAKEVDDEVLALARAEPFESALLEIGAHYHQGLVVDGGDRVLDVPVGAFVAVGHLADVLPAATVRNQKSTTARELWFGDFRDGRYAWQIDGVIPLLDPIAPEPGRNHRGLWTLTPTEAAAVQRQTRRRLLHRSTLRRQN